MSVKLTPQKKKKKKNLKSFVNQVFSMKTQ